MAREGYNALRAYVSHLESTLHHKCQILTSTSLDDSTQQNMAARSALLFAGQAKPSDNAPRGYSEIQLRALQMLFDIVMVFHVDVLGEDGVFKSSAGACFVITNFSSAFRLKKSLMCSKRPCNPSHHQRCMLRHVKGWQSLCCRGLSLTKRYA